MQRVAGRLGYTAMSLYRYVPGKDQLIDVMCDVALGPPPPADPSTTDWRIGVDRLVAANLAVYARHPWLVQVSVSAPPLGPNHLAWFDALLRQFAGLGLQEAEMVHLAMFISSAVRDLARISIELAHTPERTGISVEEMGEGFTLALRRVADGERFPALARVAAAGVFDPNELPYNDIRPSLDFGLQRLLDGVDGYVRARLTDAGH